MNPWFKPQIKTLGFNCTTLLARSMITKQNHKKLDQWLGKFGSIKKMLFHKITTFGKYIFHWFITSALFSVWKELLKNVYYNNRKEYLMMYIFLMTLSNFLFISAINFLYVYYEKNYLFIWFFFFLLFRLIHTLLFMESGCGPLLGALGF